VRRDFLGLEVSSASDATLQAIDDFIGGFLAYEERMAGIVAAADADAGSVLANTYAGLLWMMLESAEAPERARRYVERAQAVVGSATRRERMTLAFLEHWMREDIDTATRIADEVLAEYPRDLAMLKLHQYHDFNRGRCTEMLRVAHGSFAAASDVPHLHGMLAFAYEQCHLLAEAEHAARHALALQRREPWAQHALAHVLLTQGRIREGLAFMTEVSDTWTGLVSFMDTHNWWHLALFEISEGRFESALRRYDEHCWARDRSYSQDQIGAVSLLARLELAGADVGGRWTDLAEHLRARATDTVQPFLSLQYLYGLARAGRGEAGTLLEAIRVRSVTAPPALRVAWREVALPAAEGVLAHARSEYAAAVGHLGPALGRMLEIGGSHAQRDLFEQLYLDSLLRSGHRLAAQQLLERRRAMEPEGVPLNRTLAALYAELGLPEEAAKAERRAERPVRVTPAT
jgi:tetratricopeptide (TPR) repeat protein